MSSGFVQRTDILAQPPKATALPHWHMKTWREAIEARACGTEISVGVAQANAAATATLANLTAR